ncbi:MAG: WD40 repeat domain-containing protein, partial [Pyrinomonadaceae bacterium]
MLFLVFSGCASLPTPKIKEPSELLPNELATSPIPRIEPGAHTAPIFSIDADATGRVLVTGSRDETVRIWAVREGQLLNTLRLPIGVGYWTSTVAISPDGTTVAVGGATGSRWKGFLSWVPDFSIYIFDRVRSRLVRRLSGLPFINDLAFSRDGRYLAASTRGKNGIGVYRTDNWLLVAEDRNYGDDGSSSVDFASDGRLVSTSADGFIRLYGSDFRLLVKQEAPKGKRTFAARFSPEGARIAVGFDDALAVDVLDAQDLHLLYAPDIGKTGFFDLSSGVKVAWSQD